MSVVKVIASVDHVSYELEQNGETYSEEIAAPDESTELSVMAIDEYGNTAEETEELIVLSEWLPPKTDWTSEDYFNAVDYNRIIGNITYLKILANKLFKSFDITSMGEDKEYLSMIYAREINTIEDNLETINLKTYRFNLGEKQTYRANGSTPLWSEFNRIESACLLLYNTLKSHKESLPRLAFTLGCQKGIRV